ncbi:Beta-1-syntrophin [Fukomys damarensis]|uniref:Beta-1-syntrophin n=1 Tax=Fukomys damarensis TaxID=885580 RepID=A0A091DY28_FUKDA|nr:Beta-1-syntrophin [Fukomys damarensis]
MREATPYVKKGSPVSEIGWETPPPESPRLGGGSSDPQASQAFCFHRDQKSIPLRMCYVTRSMALADPENSGSSVWQTCLLLFPHPPPHAQPSNRLRVGTECTDWCVVEEGEHGRPGTDMLLGLCSAPHTAHIIKGQGQADAEDFISSDLGEAPRPPWSPDGDVRSVQSAHQAAETLGHHLEEKMTTVQHI